jgi:arylsulfatase A-like enzyme
MKKIFATSLVLHVTFVSAIDMQKPNVILVLADDLGYGDLSCYNSESKIFTPNIDKLSENGILFTDAHAASALSTPTRYSILTGRYPWRTTLKEGVLSGYSKALIAPGRKTIADLFSSSGYRTACIGKWHLGWDWNYKDGSSKNDDVDFTKPIVNGPTERGFDYFYGIPASLDIAPYVYVENNLATSIPNRIIQPQKGFLLMHGGVASPDFNEEECLPELIGRSVKYIKDQENAESPFFLYLPLTAPHTPVLPTAEFRGKTPIGDYGDFVVMVDHMIKQITDALEKTNQTDNTIIIFTSDNGYAPYIGVTDLENKGHYPSYIYRGYKSDIYEGGHRVPLIVSYGKRYANIINNSLVSLNDFYATFADMLDYKLADNEAEDSYSLWSVLSRKGLTSRPDVVCASANGSLSIRTPQFKLIFAAGSGGWGYPRKSSDLAGLPLLQLFDIQKDPSEKNNLINSVKYAVEIKKMTFLMRKYVEDGRSTPGKKVNNDTPNNWPQTKLFMQ